MTRTTVTLLGTAGGPGGHARRAGIATLVRVGKRGYLFDAGDGVSHQLALAGLPIGDVDLVLLTHLHDDHTSGLPGLVSFRQTMRQEPLTMIGPPGTTDLRTGLLAFLATNTAIRGAESLSFPPLDETLVTHEARPGVVWQDDDVRITAVENSHYALTDFGSTHESYAYRFDGPDRSIVLTGDTGESDAVVQLARGADLLLCEMVTERDAAAVPPPVREHMRAEHLSPAQVGRLAAAAGVSAVALTHYSEASAADLEAIAAEFDGEVVAGEDLMQL